MKIPIELEYNGTMENTTTLNAYFTNVLSNEDLDLLHDDDVWIAIDALQQVPTLLGHIDNGVAAKHDISNLKSYFVDLTRIFSLINENAPNPEIAAFLASLKIASKTPRKVGPTFLADFSRIVDAYLTEGSKILHN